jgi:hypothetical protein
MPDRIRARALVVALLIVLTVAAIGSLGPRGAALEHASDVSVVAVLLELALAGLLIALRWRHAPATPVAARLNQILRAALITGLVVVPIIYFIYRANPDTSLFPNKVPIKVKPVQVHGVPPKTHDLPFTFSGQWRALLIALAVIAIAAVLYVIWRNRTRLDAAIPQELTVDDESELARAVQSGRTAFGQLDDARAAIIACYVAMEASLARAGTERGLAETPDELLDRAVTAGHAPARPAGQLTALFYEARFSTHPMPAAKREAAERALADLAADLPIGEPR